MDPIQTILDCHTDELLGYVDAGSNFDAKGVLRLIDRIEIGYDPVTADDVRSPYRPGERVFWFVLFSLEHLALAMDPANIHPYERIELKAVAGLRNRLQKRLDLPRKYQVCRPGELSLPMDDEEEPPCYEYDPIAGHDMVVTAITKVPVLSPEDPPTELDGDQH